MQLVEICQARSYLTGLSVVKITKLTTIEIITVCKVSFP